jgi:RNA polymerase sigma-70 factor (ECF subfamily)
VPGASSDTHPLLDAFLQQAPDGWREMPGELLEEQLRAAHESGRGAWPSVDLDGVTFARYLGARAPESTDQLSRLSFGGLYLACACAMGDGDAARELVRAFLPRVKRALRRYGDDAFVDDVAQHTLRALIVEDGLHRARIGSYDGRGDLEAWVVVAASREGLQAVTRAAKRTARQSDDHELAMLADTTGDPEMRVLRDRYRGEFKRAFEKGLASLSSRERTLLRYQYLDGLGIEEVAGLYGVSRATAARWRAKARRRLLEETRRVLREQVGMNESELDSLMRLIQSNIDVTLSRLLRADG